MVNSGLPPELERNVFKLAALDRPLSIPKLIRVAWRVKQWVEPLLYRTLVIDDKPIHGIPCCDMDTFRRITETKSPDFLADAVRNVMVGSSDDDHLQTIFSACPGIQNLYSSGNPYAPRAALDILPLRHLYCALGTVFDSSAHVHDAGSRRIFAHLTHLQLFRGGPEPRDNELFVSTLAQIPNLSHLSMYPTLQPIYSQILDACTHLRVLVVLTMQIWRGEQYAGLSDVRFVRMRPRRSAGVDWELGILTGNNFWARAEAIVARKIAGKRSIQTMKDDMGRFISTSILQAMLYYPQLL
ncbi:hypothetical protein GGX14DRAFT_647743 [Mycena pura]|uniref:F-box domain-containing protein n=1 Tax=Mycena pura TaxID=153505 RepID=A0AAD6YDM3_9AGAR|nr:hypothetical protein GGX14DRAFT_647743 [Mycena pura]